MQDPRAGRPHMPGYGVRSSDDGLLAWSWAQEPRVPRPDVNATVRVVPQRAFGLADEELEATATRWIFDG